MNTPKTMFRYLGTIPILLSILLTFSCRKSELMTFDGDRMLYFSRNSIDSLNVNFSLLADDRKDTVVKIPIMLLGLPLNKPTTFEISIDPATNASKGEDFNMTSQLSFPAHKSSDTLEIKFIRTAKLAAKEYVLSLSLKPTPDFNTTSFNFDSKGVAARRVRIFFSDIFPMTKRWKGIDGRLGTEYYLGRFTKKKMKLISSLYPKWSFQNLYDNIDRNGLFFGNLLQSHLKKNKEAGAPVLEDDGTLMEVGPYYTK